MSENKKIDGINKFNGEEKKKSREVVLESINQEIEKQKNEISKIKKLRKVDGIFLRKKEEPIKEAPLVKDKVTSVIKAVPETEVQKKEVATPPQAQERPAKQAPVVDEKKQIAQKKVWQEQVKTEPVLRIIKASGENEEEEPVLTREEKQKLKEEARLRKEREKIRVKEEKARKKEAIRREKDRLREERARLKEEAKKRELALKKQRQKEKLARREAAKQKKEVEEKQRQEDAKKRQKEKQAQIEKKKFEKEKAKQERVLKKLQAKKEKLEKKRQKQILRQQKIQTLKFQITNFFKAFKHGFKIYGRKIISVIVISLFFIIVVYTFILVFIVKFHFDNTVTRRIANIIPVPAIITDAGIVEYYSYTDLVTNLFLQKGTTREEAQLEAKYLIAQQMIVRDLAQKYGIKDVQSDLLDAVRERVPYDNDINQVAINRVYKIKEMINQGSDFVSVANKYGDSQGKLDLTDDNKKNYPFANELEKLNINEVSDIVVTKDGYYIFKVFGKIGSNSALSYVFVRAVSLDEYVSEKIMNYKMWSLVK